MTNIQFKRGSTPPEYSTPSVSVAGLNARRVK